MQHDIHYNGYAFRLRPVEVDDAELIIKLRTSQPNRTQYLHPIDPDINIQRDYLKRYLQEVNDYYFVLERSGNNNPEGLVGIYDIDPIKKTGEWGRWVLVDRSLGAVESCWLTYQVGFTIINLRHIYCRTIVDNKSVVSFHDSCGLKNRNTLFKHFNLHGQHYDAIEHSIGKNDWDLSIEQDLNRKAQLIARRLNR